MKNAGHIAPHKNHMNDTIKRNLDFHQTFKPERNCLNAMLTDLQDCCEKSIQEISQITGIPTGKSSGKIIPTIYYLEYMGLISKKCDNKKYDFDYTLLGQTIMAEDPGLMEPLTLLLMHCMITRKRAGAELWSYIVCELMPKYHGKISKPNLDKELLLYFDKTVNVAPFNGSYTGIFESLNLIQVTTSEYIMNPCIFNAEYIYLYAYILYEYWDQWIGTFSEEELDKKKISKTELTSLQLADTGFRLPFGWSEQDEYVILQEMHDKNIIALNRQMTPFSIRRICSKEELTDLLYSELC